MSGLVDFFLPREKKFFVLLEKQAHLVTVSIKRLKLLTTGTKVQEKQVKLALVDLRLFLAKAEQLSHEITSALHQTFITPIDRDEIQSLTVHLTRMMDSIEKITFSISYCGVKRFDKYLLNQISLLEEAVGILETMFQKPLDAFTNLARIEKVRMLEQKADDTYRKAVGELFQNGHRPMAVMRKKELYTMAEEAVDDVRHVVGIFETILINHS